MKIGYFTSKFPFPKNYRDYLCGGSIISTYNTVNELAKNHEISVFTTSINRKDNTETYQNLTIFRYGSFKFATANISLSHIYKPLNHHVDIAHVSLDVPPGPISGLVYHNRRKVPLVVTYHGDWIGEYGGIIRRLGVFFSNKLIFNKLLSKADTIICPSNIESNVLESYKEKIKIIPNGIHLDEFDIPFSKEECRYKLDIPPETKVVLFVGHLLPHKGPDVLLKAVPQILKSLKNIKVIYLGSGQLQNSLINMSRKMNINKNIEFQGYVEDKFKKALYYKAADVLVLPSFSESFGIVNLEAMASGLPIVASNVGGIPNVVIHSINGLLFDAGDHRALADEIIYIFQNDELREFFAKNGKKMVQDYSWEKIALKIERVYEELT